MKRRKTFTLALFALYVALIFVLDATPLGYIPMPGGINATTVFLPVIFAATTLGPLYGAAAGFFFGATSFLQCFGFGAVVDPLAATLFHENPALYAVMCFVPRVLMGFAVGWIFKALQKIDRTRVISYAVASVSAAVLNTLLFLTAFNLFFGDTPFSGTTIRAILSTVIAVNGVAEMLIALVVGTAGSKALATGIKHLPQ